MLARVSVRRLLQHAVVDAAGGEATGRLTLKVHAIVTEVVYDRDRKRATGVRVLDATVNQTTDYTARVVFLCASTLNSTWIL